MQIRVCIAKHSSKVWHWWVSHRRWKNGTRSRPIWYLNSCCCYHIGTRYVAHTWDHHRVPAEGARLSKPEVRRLFANQVRVLGLPLTLSPRSSKIILISIEQAPGFCMHPPAELGGSPQVFFCTLHKCCTAGSCVCSARAHPCACPWRKGRVDVSPIVLELRANRCV